MRNTIIAYIHSHICNFSINLCVSMGLSNTEKSRTYVVTFHIPFTERTNVSHFLFSLESALKVRSYVHLYKIYLRN